MGYVVRMQFDGLTVFVPFLEENTLSLAALVVNALDPNPQSSVPHFTHYPHHPRIKFRESDVVRINQVAAPLGISNGTVTWDLAGDDLRFDVVDGGFGDPEGVIRSHPLQHEPVRGAAPQNGEERRDHRWYPRLKKIYDDVEPTVDPALVTGELNAELLAARLTFTRGTVVSDPSAVTDTEFCFVDTKTDEPAVADHKQRLAGALVAELVVVEDMSQREPPPPIFRLWSSRGTSVDLYPSIENTLDIVVENVSERPGDYRDKVGRYLPGGGCLDVDFELAYRIARPPEGRWLVPAYQPCRDLGTKVHPCAGTFTG